MPAIKPQVAFFERHGPEGLRVLAELSSAAKQRDLLVIMDGKRGDIGTTAQAYAEAWLGPSIVCSRCVTINPYLGFDSLEPFLSRANRPYLVCLFWLGPVILGQLTCSNSKSM